MTIAEELGAAIDACAGRADLSGVVRVSRDAALLFEQAYGQASVQLGVSNRPETRFHIASVTKVFISAAIMRLVDEGRISLDRHPSAYMPELAALDGRITLHHLLCHTAGIGDIYDQPGVRLAAAKTAQEGGRLLDLLVTMPQAFEPGAKWAYSSSGFLLLAYVAEAVASKSFGPLLRDMFFDRLGLNDTGPDDPLRINPGRASGHIVSDGTWTNARNDDLAELDGPREHYATAADLDRWVTAVHAGDVLSEASRRLTFAEHARIGPGSHFDPNWGYGYGWFLAPDYHFVGGMTHGFSAVVWRFPAEALNIVMLWNREGINGFGVLQAMLPILRR